MIFLKNKNIISFIFLVIVVFLSATGFAYAQTQGTGEGLVYTGCEGDSCDFDHFILAIQHALGYAFTIALTLSVGFIAYAGYIYMTSEGNPGKIAEANRMFKKIATGIFFVLAAWLIVEMIVNALVDPNQITNLME